jgi:hypothetical protein
VLDYRIRNPHSHDRGLGNIWSRLRLCNIICPTNDQPLEPNSRGLTVSSCLVNSPSPGEGGGAFGFVTTPPPKNGSAVGRPSPSSYISFGVCGSDADAYYLLTPMLRIPSGTTIHRASKRVLATREIPRMGDRQFLGLC